MATAAKMTIAEVNEIVEVGEIDPETIVTPEYLRTSFSTIGCAT